MKIRHKCWLAPLHTVCGTLFCWIPSRRSCVTRLGGQLDSGWSPPRKKAFHGSNDRRRCRWLEGEFERAVGLWLPSDLFALPRIRDTGQLSFEAHHVSLGHAGLRDCLFWHQLVKISFCAGDLADVICVQWESFWGFVRRDGTLSWQLENRNWAYIRIMVPNVKMIHEGKISKTSLYEQISSIVIESIRLSKTVRSWKWALDVRGKCPSIFNNDLRIFLSIWHVIFVLARNSII